MIPMHYVSPFRKEEPPLIKAVSFKASKPDGLYGLHKIHEVDFTLGIGPCGRYVEKLTCEVSAGLLRVTQESYTSARPFRAFSAQQTEELAEEFRPRWFGLRGDKEVYRNLQAEAKKTRSAVLVWRDTVEIKEFIYKMSDVHGRVVITR